MKTFKNFVADLLKGGEVMSGKDTVRELCGSVWSEVYGYEKK